MNRDKCKSMCTSPRITLREKLFFKMIYETTTRPGKVPEAGIGLWDRSTGEITFPFAATTAGAGAASRVRPGP